MSSDKPVLINGEIVNPKTAAISIWDVTIQRGDGLFEIIAIERSGEGKLLLVGLDLHFVRLFRCAKQLLLDIKQTETELESWLRKAAELGGPGKLRVLVTRGGTQDSISHMGAVDINDIAPPKVIIIWQEVDNYNIPEGLLPVEYPWNCSKSEVHSTIKWLSYASNMLMTRTAVKAGFDDALLMTEDGVVLEGPTFSVCWIKNGEIFTPSVKETKILPSITMAITMTAMHNAGYNINVGRSVILFTPENKSLFTDIF